jgi:hypothetical protein
MDEMEQLAWRNKAFVLMKMDLVISLSNYLVRGEASPASMF